MRAIITFLILSISSQLIGQENFIILKGKIVNSMNNEPIYYASIAVYENDDIIDGMVSDDNGNFTLHIAPNATRFDVSYVGFTTKSFTIEKYKNTKFLEIKLESSITTLDEVFIENKKTVSQLKIDRKVINIGTDLQQSGTTALEAFEQIVDIQTDISTGSISLRGSGNVRVLVNGKPSPINTFELLDQIPSSSIDRIEITTSPSAKQQADGLSGIINVILKKNKTKGFNTKLNSSVGTRRFGFGMDLNYSFNRYNFRLNSSYTNRRIESQQTLFRTFGDGTKEDIFTPTSVDGNTKLIAFGVDIFLNEKNEFSVDFNHTDDPHTFNNPSFYTNVTGEDDFIYKRKAFHEHLTSNFNLNYRYKINDEDYLEADYNYIINNNEAGATDFRNQLFVFEQLSEDTNSLHTFAFDFSNSFSENIHFETGLLWNQRHLDLKFKIDLDNTSTNNRFDYLENILGVYAMSNLKFGKLSTQVGLRYEYFDSKSSNTIGEGHINRTFSNIFPSIHFSYNFNDDNVLNIGYSKRISRPDYRQLNPFQIGNPFFNFEGSPNLKPEFSDNIEMNYQSSNDNFNWAISGFYRYRKNAIQRFDRIEENGVQVASYQNKGVNNVMGIEGNLNYDIKDYWSSDISANYYFTKINGFNMVTWDELYSSNIQIKNTIQLNSKFSFDFTYRHMFKNQGAFRFIEPRDRIDFAARAKFIDNRLNVNLRIVDLLDINLMKRNTRINDYVQNEIWEFQTQTRNYLVNITYQLFKNSSLSRNRKQRQYDIDNTMN